MFAYTKIDSWFLCYGEIERVPWEPVAVLVNNRINIVVTKVRIPDKLQTDSSKRLKYYRVNILYTAKPRLHVHVLLRLSSSKEPLP